MNTYSFNWSPMLGRFDHHLALNFAADSALTIETLSHCSLIMNRIRIVIPMLAWITVSLVLMGAGITAIIVAHWHLALLAIPITIGVNAAVWSALWVWREQTRKRVNEIETYLKTRSTDDMRWSLQVPRLHAYTQENWMLNLQIKNS